jgi:hypothetical protein
MDEGCNHISVNIYEFVKEFKYVWFETRHVFVGPWENDNEKNLYCQK